MIHREFHMKRYYNVWKVNANSPLENGKYRDYHKMKTSSDTKTSSFKEVLASCPVRDEMCRPLRAAGTWKNHHCCSLLPVVWSGNRNIISVNNKSVILRPDNARIHSAEQTQEKKKIVRIERFLPIIHTYQILHL